jgi:cytochrome P450
MLDQRMEDVIKTAIADSEANEKSNSSRSVVHLALKGREITPATISHAADQLRSFIFAGFDTTSTLLQWTFYYLSLPENDSILEDLVSEHDAVLGPLSNPSAIDSILTADPLLPLTTAVIKESLRLQPPASSARWVPNTNAPVTITIPSDNSTHTINGSVIYIAHSIIHTSPKIWGPDALTFRPSRWLDKDYVAALPAGSWRPFERGPRGCIGQELALQEAKVALALTVRRFAFTKVDEDGRESGVVRVEEKPDLWTGEGEVWNKYVITASPGDGMRMRVRKR